MAMKHSERRSGPGTRGMCRASRVLLAAASAVLLTPVLAFGAQTTFEVSLTGPETSGDRDGQGQATLTLNPEANQVEVRLSYSNIARPTAMHIRWGATGLEGNVVVPIPIEGAEDGTVVGQRQSAMPDIVKTILAAPEEYYLVVINEEFPVGALRGPLRE